MSGTINELFEQADLIIDASPSKVGAKNKSIYEKLNKPAIFQGGEKANTVEVSFSSLCNYENAIGKKYVRVVSCNTTALCRLLCTMRKNIDIGKVRVTLIRRAADPKEFKKGPINAIHLKPIKLPSHHGPDVQSVVGDIDIVTTALIVPTTLMHVHVVNVELKDKVSADDVVEFLRKEPRIMLINSEKLGIEATSQVIEMARDLGRVRYDLYENIVWEDSIGVDGNELWLVQAVHQEAIVVPENIDAIRAVTGIEKDPVKSIEKTNKTLGIGGVI